MENQSGAQKHGLGHGMENNFIGDDQDAMLIESYEEPAFEPTGAEQEENQIIEEEKAEQERPNSLRLLPEPREEQKAKFKAPTLEKRDGP